MTKTVLEKLGYKPGTAAVVIDAPTEIMALLAGVTIAPVGPAPFVIGFAECVRALELLAPQIVASGQRGGHVWIAYPKKTGAIKTDITRDICWGPIEAAGLLPVTQIALDATWSALRWRYRDEIAKLTRKSETRA